jgi:hypothetical protein
MQHSNSISAASLERIGKAVKQAGGSDWSALLILISLVRFFATRDAALRSSTARELYELALWLDADVEHARRH